MKKQATTKELALPATVKLLTATNICQKAGKETPSCKDIMSWVEEFFEGRRLQLDIIVRLMHSMDKPADAVLLWNDTATPQEVIDSFNKLLVKLGYKLRGTLWTLKLKRTG